MSVVLALLAAAAGADAAPEPRDGDVVVTGERTENSDDYAVKAQTTATRIPLSPRETPQSVSIVTRAQIEDFQLTDVNQLLATVPGVNVQAAETDRTILETCLVRQSLAISGKTNHLLRPGGGSSLQVRLIDRDQGVMMGDAIE